MIKVCQGQDLLMLSMLREDILPVTRRTGAGNRLKESTRLKSKNARKGTKPFLALFHRHSNVFFQTELHKINGS